MTQSNHLLVLDAISFSGGSKIATENILRLVNTDEFRITVLTADKESWSYSNLNKIKLYQPRFIIKKVHGIPYFFNNFIIFLQLVFIYIRYGRFNVAIGSSGPGVDLSLYLLKSLINFKLIQLIQGNVSNSGTIARYLLKADKIYYLKSTAKSILSSVNKSIHYQYELKAPKFELLENGLSEHSWPTRCQTESPVLHWSASTLKWKGLDTFINALTLIEEKRRPETNICYIEPKNISLESSDIFINLSSSVHWYNNPECLDDIRASSNIFVSTSHNEPFGLSILEAMAAGHCILIPKDNAYWDCMLVDEVNCIKYRPEDALDLAKKIDFISHDMSLVKKIGEAAERVSRKYHADKRYAPIIEQLNTYSTTNKANPLAQSNSELLS